MSCGVGQGNVKNIVVCVCDHSGLEDSVLLETIVACNLVEINVSLVIPTMLCRPHEDVVILRTK